MWRRGLSACLLLCGLAGCQAYDQPPTAPAPPSTGEPIHSGRPTGMLLSPSKPDQTPYF